ncbi:MAG: metalloregulator ArsR/SmtB family transcription factor [Thermoflexales bacterium]
MIKVESTIPSAVDAARVAELFQAMSDPSRVRILLALLQGEVNVGAIAEKVGISESAVSHQLRGLRQLRIVSARKDGRSVFYSLDDDHVVSLLTMGLEHVGHSISVQCGP